MKFDDNRFYSVKEIIVKNGGPLPLSISTVYSAIKAGEIPVKKVGKRMLIPGKFLAERFS